MHNLLSHNQHWMERIIPSSKQILDRSMEESDVINDYYDCLIECDDSQATCKKVCREVLRDHPVG